MLIFDGTVVREEYGRPIFLAAESQRKYASGKAGSQIPLRYMILENAPRFFWSIVKQG